MTTKAEAQQYFETLHKLTFSEVSIGSYAFEFLPSLIEPREVDTYKKLLSLGCGHADELIACRMFFGDSITLTGIDNNPELQRDRDQKELHENLGLAGAQFLHANMSNISGILQNIDKPDIITIRHPGPLHNQFDQIAKRLTPWFQYAGENEITTVLSFFNWHGNEKDRLVTDVIQQFVKPSQIRLQDKEFKNARAYYSINSSSNIYPDFYGVRLF